MTVQNLMEAVAARVKGCWPGEEVYTKYLPKDFKRPSFALELQKDEWTDVNIALVHRTVTLLLTGFVATDAYGDSDRDVLNQRMETACSLFACGVLPVDDRAIRVQTIRGTGAPDFFEVTLIFSWIDVRPDAIAPDAPRMEHFELNMTAKE